MSRPLRIEISDAWYHVLNRGRRRESIFRSTKDYEIFLQTVQEACEFWHLWVAAYCLLSNHYHLLVQTPNANLSRGSFAIFITRPISAVGIIVSILLVVSPILPWFRRKRILVEE